MSSEPRFLTSLKLELAYFGGDAWLKRQGAGVILRFHVAICDMHILAADKMEAVVVVIDAVMDVDAMEIHVM